MLALVGVTLLPIIKFSVEWWNTLHQPSTDFTSTVDPSMRWPLLVMALGFTLLFFAMHLKAMRNEILRRRVKAHADARRCRSRSARGTRRGGVTASWTSGRTPLSSGFRMRSSR